MLPEKSNTDSYFLNIVWALVVVLGLWNSYTYWIRLSKKEDDKNYEDIIAEKDRIIEEQQIQLERQNKIIEDLK